LRAAIMVSSSLCSKLMMKPATATTPGGVTLVELMVTLVVLALLASLATAGYRHWLLRADRTDATAALLHLQVQQERYFLQNQRYARDAAELQANPPLGLGFTGAQSERGRYLLSLTSDSATRYTATARATGPQQQDAAACQSLSLNERGERTPPPSSLCWR
jgi:type IV pilus assembly protein PilE